jgi:hypothetical protein
MVQYKISGETSDALSDHSTTSMVVGVKGRAWTTETGVAATLHHAEGTQSSLHILPTALVLGDLFGGEGGGCTLDGRSAAGVLLYIVMCYRTAVPRGVSAGNRVNGTRTILADGPATYPCAIQGLDMLNAMKHRSGENQESQQNNNDVLIRCHAGLV